MLSIVTLRDKNGTADFSKWPDHQQWDEAERQPLSSPRNKAYKDVEFYYFVQFILSSQLKAVHDYATSRRVILKRRYTNWRKPLRLRRMDRTTLLQSQRTGWCTA